MDRGALHHALEAGGRLRVAGAVGDEAGQLLVENSVRSRRSLSRSTLQARSTVDGVLVVGQRQQQMLERRVFVPALVGEARGAMQRLSRDCVTAWATLLLDPVVPPLIPGPVRFRY